ncbi:DUF1330 domain-containing protein [Streptomyces sp. BI20]|uniref:DUF1330 domain-containing protein n=1 Tax=Streptomyces sp. BI20 TaxID=3403460 RepID=UPI003C796395
MTAYAIAHLTPGTLTEEVFVYIERMQATLDPFQGRFLVHGVRPEVLEGPWDGDIVLIGFPDIEAARAWYASEGYQRILPLRTKNIPCTVALLPGVPEGYDPAATAAAMRAATTTG